MVGIQSGDKPTLMGVQTIQVDINGTVGIYITSQHCQNMVDGCEILHQLIGGKHPTIFRVSQPSAWWCRISSIHSMFIVITIIKIFLGCKVMYIPRSANNE
jgi:hypothetical protein